MPQSGAGRADKERPPGNADPALNIGPQTMEPRHLRYFPPSNAVDALRHPFRYAP
jgi:hypothetical protein